MFKASRLMTRSSRRSFSAAPTRKQLFGQTSPICTVQYGCDLIITGLPAALSSVPQAIGPMTPQHTVTSITIGGNYGPGSGLTILGRLTARAAGPVAYS